MCMMCAHSSGCSERGPQVAVPSGSGAHRGSRMCNNAMLSPQHWTADGYGAVSYTHLRAHETSAHL
eukprot:12155782-Alexandrium_andersonii.AAC.1